MSEAKTLEVSMSPDKDLVRDFLSDCRLRGMTRESVYGYGCCLRIFMEFLRRKNVQVLDVDKDVLRSFLSYLRDDRGLSLKRVENYFTPLSKLFSIVSLSLAKEYGLRAFYHAGERVVWVN